VLQARVASVTIHRVPYYDNEHIAWRHQQPRQSGAGSASPAHQSLHLRRSRRAPVDYRRLRPANRAGALHQPRATISMYYRDPTVARRAADRRLRHMDEAHAYLMAGLRREPIGSSSTGAVDPDYEPAAVRRPGAAPPLPPESPHGYARGDPRAEAAGAIRAPSQRQKRSVRSGASRVERVDEHASSCSAMTAPARRLLAAELLERGLKPPGSRGEYEEFAAYCTTAPRRRRAREAPCGRAARRRSHCGPALRAEPRARSRCAAIQLSRGHQHGELLDLLGQRRFSRR